MPTVPSHLSAEVLLSRLHARQNDCGSKTQTSLRSSSSRAHMSLRFAVSALASHLSAEVLLSRFVLDRTTVALRLKLRYARLR